jgi:hypothetical protein
MIPRTIRIPATILKNEFTLLSTSSEAYSAATGQKYLIIEIIGTAALEGIAVIHIERTWVAGDGQ